MSNPASTFPSAPPRFFDRGSGAKLLQPANQVTFVADVAGAAGANPTQAEYLVAVTAINSLKTALVTAGIMLPS